MIILFVKKDLTMNSFFERVVRDYISEFAIEEDEEFEDEQEQ